MHSRWILAALAFGTFSAADAANRPVGYVTICNEGKTCFVPSATRVAFGRSDQFFYKEVDQTFMCNEATFGGRIAGGVNECSAPKVSSSSSSSSSSGSSSSSSSSSSGGLYPAKFGCAQPTRYLILRTTIVVPANGVFDGGCGRYIAQAITYGDPTQPTDTPMVILENGASFRNAILVSHWAGEAVQVRGNAQLQNVSWERAPNAALAIKGSGTVVIDGGFALGIRDKVFAMDAPSTLAIKNFEARNASKFVRQAPSTTFPTNLVLDRIDVREMAEAIFRTDGSSSTVRFSNSNYCNVGRKWWGASRIMVFESNNTECGPGL